IRRPRHRSTSCTRTPRFASASPRSTRRARDEDRAILCLAWTVHQTAGCDRRIAGISWRTAVLARRVSPVRPVRLSLRFQAYARAAASTVDRGTTRHRPLRQDAQAETARSAELCGQHDRWNRGECARDRAMLLGLLGERLELLHAEARHRAARVERDR